MLADNLLLPSPDAPIDNIVEVVEYCKDDTRYNELINSPFMYIFDNLIDELYTTVIKRHVFGVII